MFAVYLTYFITHKSSYESNTHCDFYPAPRNVILMGFLSTYNVASLVVLFLRTKINDRPFSTFCIV